MNLFFINLVKKSFYLLGAPILAVLMLITGLLDAFAVGGAYKYESIDKVVGLEAFERSQGITTDGESFIFSGKTSLVRIAFDNVTILAANYSAIPDELVETFGSAHIGGISYYDGKIYAGVEDSKVFEHPLIVVYDAQTLEYTGVYKEVDTQYQIRGIPWVACDPQNGYIYSAQCRNSPVLILHDLETLEFVGTVELETPVDRIQGSEMYNGKLYAATNDATRAVYEIDPLTGAVRKYFDRIMYQSVAGITNAGGEGEGITVLERDDGTVFHALDLGALFINSNLKHYKPIN